MARLDEMRQPVRGPSMPVMFIYLMIGPLLWALHLLLTYGAHTLFCALGGSAAGSTAFLLAATAAIALPLALILLSQRAVGRLFGVRDDLEECGIYDSISRIASILSLAGILWSGTAITLISSCAPGR